MNAALLLALFGRKPEQVTVTFNSNTTWTAPAGVTVLATLTGEGTDGQPAVYGVGTVSLIICSGDSEQVGGSTVSRYSAIQTGANEWNKFSGTGTRTVSFQRTRYFTGTDNLTRTTVSSASAVVRGEPIDLQTSSYTGDFTYANVNSTYCRGVIEVRQSASTTGASATAFGKTFPGGAGGPAVQATYLNEPVTPGQSYSIVVPTGATVQITYYV